MSLCRNRPEGFGPHSTLSSPLPTACFADTIIIPLPVWLALILFPVLYVLSIHHRSQNFDPSTSHLRIVPPRNWLFTTLTAIYYVLIVCNILMETLEIVRLALIHFGIALLPFTYVGLLLGGSLHLTGGLHGRVRGWQAVNTGVLWLGGLAVNAVKAAGLSKEGIDTRKGSKYPLSDQVVDVAVIAGIYAVLGILEMALGFWGELRTARAERARLGSLRSGMSPPMEWNGSFK
ncbi:Uncharacterized protein BP5553_04410 [Venustampulla echinocandica]|uniref:Uncharacterized protein n=1 Tax=Venustampulla echinocandica TaxID=2656787 RepID=A0A370TN77_9HELO|nr:Uncharacterized protein BP5553_04410 [Venustampulla echinocandica]RDL36977.1 Uncharacterized protein BP5553_04410 [Venustampulla echinocandica]